MRSPCCLCIPPIKLWMPEPIFMKFGMYIMAPEPISMAYFTNPSHQSVCLYVYPPIIARQRLGKNVTAATNSHATIKELLDASYSVRSVPYQRKVYYWLFPELLFSESYLYKFGWTRWMGDQPVSRPLHVDIPPCSDRDSNTRSQCWIGNGHCDRLQEIFDS
jgi:hypothetical protein